jgi:hypothetical protein
MSRTQLSFGVAFVFLAASAPVSVKAASDIVVMSDQAKLVSVSGKPGVVVVGNPSIADVTVQGDRVFVHGRNWGTTNLIVLDRSGNQIAIFDVTVMAGGANNVGVYKAGNKFSFVCDPNCETSLQVGDYHNHLKDIHEEMTGKSALAMGASKE